MEASIGVNERDARTLYDTQLLFDADYILIQSGRKISQTCHERLIWGQDDGSWLRAIEGRRIGLLVGFEHDKWPVTS